MKPVKMTLLKILVIDISVEIYTKKPHGVIHAVCWLQSRERSQYNKLNGPHAGTYLWKDDVSHRAQASVLL